MQMEKDQKIEENIPMRATYENLYKWPESDYKFMESIVLRRDDGGSSSMRGDGAAVDSFSCRQSYLRSYTFSRKEDYKTVNCLGRCESEMKRRFPGVGSRSMAVLRRWLCINSIDVID